MDEKSIKSRIKWHEYLIKNITIPQSGIDACVSKYGKNRNEVIDEFINKVKKDWIDWHKKELEKLQASSACEVK